VVGAFDGQLLVVSLVWRARRRRSPAAPAPRARLPAKGCQGVLNCCVLSLAGSRWHNHRASCSALFGSVQVRGSCWGSLAGAQTHGAGQGWGGVGGGVGGWLGGLHWGASLQGAKSLQGPRGPGAPIPTRQAALTSPSHAGCVQAADRTRHLSLACAALTRRLRGVRRSNGFFVSPPAVFAPALNQTGTDVFIIISDNTQISDLSSVKPTDTAVFRHRVPPPPFPPDLPTCG
jgi:hypothetical protein